MGGRDIAAFVYSIILQNQLLYFYMLYATISIESKKHSEEGENSYV